MQFFSYKPCSGSRVIASKSVLGLAVVPMSVGTVIVGDGVVLTFPAADPGHWYRDTASRFAEEVVALHGGLAEDAQGDIALVVRTDVAWEVNKLANQLLPVADEDVARNQRALWLGGAVRLQRAMTYGSFAEFVRCPPPVEYDESQYSCRIAGQAYCWAVEVTRREHPAEAEGEPAVWKSYLRFGFADPESGNFVRYDDVSDKGRLPAVDLHDLGDAMIFNCAFAEEAVRDGNVRDLSIVISAATVDASCVEWHFAGYPGMTPVRTYFRPCHSAETSGTVMSDESDVARAFRQDDEGRGYPPPHRFATLLARAAEVIAIRDDPDGAHESILRWRYTDGYGGEYETRLSWLDRDRGTHPAALAWQAAGREDDKSETAEG